jgi:hypothetical protein
MGSRTRTRAHSSSPFSDIGSGSDIENDKPSAPPRKRRRTGGASSSGSSDMKEMREMMKASEERRAVFEGKIVKALEDSTGVYEKTQDKFINVLMDKLN